MTGGEFPVAYQGGDGIPLVEALLNQLQVVLEEIGQGTRDVTQDVHAGAWDWGAAFSLRYGKPKQVG